MLGLVVDIVVIDIVGKTSIRFKDYGDLCGWNMTNASPGFPYAELGRQLGVFRSHATQAQALLSLTLEGH